MRLAPALLFCVAARAAWAQAAPEFEVATIKLTTGQELNGAYTYPGGRIAFRGARLRYVLQIALGVEDFQISGGPGWIYDRRYDIDAKPAASSKSAAYMPSYPKMPFLDEQRQMLLTLLVQRLNLKFHRETNTGPVYLLLRGNKKLLLTDAKDKNDFPWAGGVSGGGIIGDGIAGSNESMDDLARRLGPYIHRTVLNRTDLSGSFDFRYEYHSGDDHPDVIACIIASLDGLGLKLQQSTGPIENIVIDSAAKPSEN